MHILRRSLLSYLLVSCMLVACAPDMGEELDEEPTDGSTPGTDTGGDSTDGGGSPDDNSALIAEGDVVFHTIEVPPWGNVGCAYCHCADATGGCNFSAPRIIGKSRSTIANALETVDEMEPLNPTEHEIDAVAAYLAFLATP